MKFLKNLNDIDIDGYRRERKNRTSRGGGVALYLRDHITSNLLLEGILFNMDSNS